MPLKLFKQAICKEKETEGETLAGTIDLNKIKKFA